MNRSGVLIRSATTTPEEAYQQGCQYAYQYFQMEMVRQMELHAAYNPHYTNQNQMPVINFHNHYYGPVAIANGSGSYARSTDEANRSHHSPGAPHVVEEEEEEEIFDGGPVEMKEEEGQSVGDGGETEKEDGEEHNAEGGGQSVVGDDGNDDGAGKEAQWLGLRGDDEGLYNLMDMDAYVSL